MKTKQLLLSLAAIAFLSMITAPRHAMAISKKLKKANAKNAQLQRENNDLQFHYNECQDTAAARLAAIQSLYGQLTTQKYSNDQLAIQLRDQKASNDQVLNHLKDLSVISGSQAESIKKFLESMGAKDAYIKDLQAAMVRKDSLTMVLVMNLKGAVGSIDDKDINIKIDKGVVYIDISDKMLFKTGKYQVTERAKEVLGKVAAVLLAHPDIEFMVEGHTDNVPYHEGVLADNWDLSTKRATSVIRILQTEYNIPPARMTAAGRGEYVPVSGNSTTEGKAANRRTRIVILPQLDKFFQLLEKPKN
jgi:chemotaxis protein MotB